MYKIAKKPINKDDTRISKTFRFLESDIKKLQRIATLKKATKTRVISELIRLAHAGLTMPTFKELDKFYKVIIKEFEKKENESKMIKEKSIGKTKRKVYK